MADESSEDEPWGEGPDQPPLTDTDFPLADDEDSEEEPGEWIPPIP